MKRILPSVRSQTGSVLLALAAIAVPSTAVAQAPMARPELEPAILGGGEPMVAYNAEDEHGTAHVWVAAPAHSFAREAGPDAPGTDGAPTLVRLADGRPLLAASRRDGASARIWARARDGRDWGDAIWIDNGPGEQLRPRLATGGGRTWMAWVSITSDGRSSLMAAEWTGGGFAAAETIPTGRRPGARPALAVGPDGLPHVVYAALDRHDAEIWLARRGPHRWKAPVRVTRNGRHDIAPDIAFDGERPVVVWESLQEDGYHPFSTVLEGPRHRPAPAVRLDARPGAAPRLATDAGGLAVTWAAPSPLAPRETLLRTARFRGERWERPRELGQARNARVAVAGSDEGWLIGWHDRYGVSAARVLESPEPSLEPLRGIVRAADQPIEVSLPGTYLAFGDSITAGLVRYFGVISFVDGYSVHLGNMISEAIGRNVTVDLRAIPGEYSSEGLNRLRVEMIRQPRQFVFINEGANDLANLIFGEVVRDNLIAMAQSVRGAGGLPLVATVTPRTEGNFTGGINLRIDSANALIRSALPRVSLLVDLWETFYKEPNLYSDHIHPDAGGYEVMAGSWFRALLPVLKDLLGDDDLERSRDEDALRLKRPTPPDRHQ